MLEIASFIIFTSDKGGGKCDWSRLSVCLSVCLLARLLKNAWMDWIKLYVSTDVGSWTNWLTSEPDQNRKIWNQSEIWRRSNRHLTQSRLQVTGCTAGRYCLLYVVVQGPGSFRGGSTFLYDVRLWSYGASKLPNFRILAQYKMPKNVHTGDQQHSGYIAEWLRFFHVVV